VEQTAESYKLSDIAARWGITMARERPDISLAGSPERTEFRTVIEDAAYKRFVLERIPAPALEHKERICRTLSQLQQQGLWAVIPYRRLAGKDGGYIYRDTENGCWQLAEFCEGVALDRRRYFTEEWRGLAAADFLIGLRRASENLQGAASGELFSLAQYIDRFMRHLAHQSADISHGIAPVTHFLEENFFPRYDGLVSAFCHGDFHPVNIMWGKGRIAGVIDWEFLGVKPEIYDAATMIGCVGIDDPQGIISPLVCSCIAQLKKQRLFKPESWQHLFSLTLAIRFAFLAEWHRLKNQDMVLFEIQYMNYLLKSRATIERRWELSDRQG